LPKHPPHQMILKCEKKGKNEKRKGGRSCAGLGKKERGNAIHSKKVCPSNLPCTHWNTTLTSLPSGAGKTEMRQQNHAGKTPERKNTSWGKSKGGHCCLKTLAPLSPCHRADTSEPVPDWIKKKIEKNNLRKHKPPSLPCRRNKKQLPLGKHFNPMQ